MVFAALLTAGCLQRPPGENAGILRGVHFPHPCGAVTLDEPIDLRAARGEVVHFAVEVRTDHAALRGAAGRLRIGPFVHADGRERIPPSAIMAWEVASVPADVRRAAFVRLAGDMPPVGQLPRALLPLQLDDNGVAMASFRGQAAGPASATDSAGARGVLVWVDVRIAATAAPGRYEGACEIVQHGRTLASLPVALNVEEFVLPDDRHLQVVGALEWDALARLFPKHFHGIVPQLLSRRLPEHAPAVALLDEMMRLAHDHRVNIYVPRLGPVVKWPVGRGPQCDWSDFDSVVSPWLTGEMFRDSVPAGFWPLPLPDRFERLDLPSRIEYVQAAAAHFDIMGWLLRSAMTLERPVAGRLSLLESVELSQYAARFLSAHPRLRVMVPLEEEQVHLATPQSPTRIDPDDVERLLFLAPGLVRRPPLQTLPAGRGMKVLDAGSAPDYVDAAGAFDERETRLWAMLAFLREARMLRWPDVLPRGGSLDDPAEPGRIPWFYPGTWFGVEGVVPTLALKWLRRAEQDYEYLWLAAQQGEHQRARDLARMIARPVELRAAQPVDPLYSLLSNTADQRSWDTMLDLLARLVHITQPGRPADDQARRRLEYDLSAWAQKQERPLLIGRRTDWSLGEIDAQGDRWVRCCVVVDLYSTAAPHPGRNSLAWRELPAGWHAAGDGQQVAAPGQCAVVSHALEAKIDVPATAAPSSGSLVIAYAESHSGRSFPLRLMAPVARCGRRLSPPPRIDGSLGDWVAVDAIHNGRLVRMLSRPAVQRQEMVAADVPSAVYANWTPSHLYLAFRVEGVDISHEPAGTSFVAYECRRAWGEDVCEMLMQAIYGDNSLGPLLHIAVKPRGQIEVSRRLDPRTTARPWQALEGSGIRYAATVDEGMTWRGEMGIPWEALNAAGETRRPAAVRFNFAQHQRRTGQSASWAGPVDFGRDDAFTGLLRIWDR